MQNNQPELHEDLFVNVFVDKDQKQRILYLLKSKKGRLKLKSTLPHSLKFNSKYIQPISSNKQTDSEILNILKLKKAEEYCYLISENSKLDGRTMKLEEALNIIVGSGVSTIISCIPGKLAYYEGEDQNNRFILSSV